MDHSKKKQPQSFESLSFSAESANTAQTDQLPEGRIHEQNDSQGVPQLLQDAQAAGTFGGQARQQFEELTGQPVVSSQNFLDKPKGQRKKRQLPAPEQASLFDQEDHT